MVCFHDTLEWRVHEVGVRPNLGDLCVLSDFYKANFVSVIIDLICASATSKNVAGFPSLSVYRIPTA